MNALKKDLTDKYIILDGKIYKGDITDRVFFCEDGFGCHSFTIGSAIFGEFVADGEKTRIEGDEVERLATPEEVETAKAKKNGGVKT